jgi:[ribosomal protein S5]-alanine N-acetyltransferase
MQPPARLETNRLLLRKPALADAPTLFAAYMPDPEVTRYVQWRPHTHIEQTLAFLRSCLEAWDSGKRFPYVITLKGADNPVGMVDFHINGTTVGLGYVIGRAFWGHGYVPEAVRAVIDWALNQPEIYRVNASCDVENHASARVLEKVGMQREGVLRRYMIHPSLSPEPRDCYLYAIVK